MGPALSESRQDPVATGGADLPDAVLALFLPIAKAAREVAMFGYFDPQWRLLGTRQLCGGAADAVTIPLRTIVADALAFDCALVVMGHNHPSGDPTPSDADYRLTRRLARALQYVDVHLFDHLVIAVHGYRSFRARGLL